MLNTKGSGGGTMWVDNKLSGHARVKRSIRGGRAVQGNERCIHNFGHLDFVIVDGSHEISVVLHDRASKKKGEEWVRGCKRKKMG